MTQIIVGPDELRRFARFLVDIAQEINGKKNATTQRLDDLKKTWRDQKFKEFQPEYNKATQEVDQFIKAALAYADYLERKAAKAKAYLSR